MKKHSLFKVLGITFLIYVILSWIIPTGSYSAGTFTQAERTTLGIFDALLYPAATMAYQSFAIAGLTVLFIGGLYGVLNKIGALPKAVEATVKKVGENKELFLVIVTFLFILLSSLTNQTLTLFIAIPFIVAVILSLGFNRMSAFFATFGAILVGGISSLTNHSVEAYQTQGMNFMEYFFNIKISSTIIYTAAILVVTTAVYTVFVLLASRMEKKPAKKVAKKETKAKTTKTTKAKTTKTTKEEEKKDEIVIPLYHAKEKANKKATTAVVFTIILFVICVFASFSWSSLGINFFSDIHTNFTNINILSGIVGSISAIGYWSSYEIMSSILILLVILKIAYQISWKDVYDSFMKGLKEIIPVAIMVVLVNVLLYTASSLSTSTIFATMTNTILDLSKDFNTFITDAVSFIGSPVISALSKIFDTFSIAAISFVGSPIYSTFPYLLNALYDPMTSLYASNLAMISIVTQSVFGMAMMIFPTSVILMMGLQYLNISYKEWFKNAWKVLVALAIVLLIMLAIISVII